MKAISFSLLISCTFAFQNNLTLQPVQQQQNSGAVEQISALQAELSRLTAANTSLNNSYQQLLAQTLKIQEENSSLKAQVANIATLQATITSLQSENKSVKDQFASIKADMDKLKADKDRLMDDIKLLISYLGIGYSFSSDKDFAGRVGRDDYDVLIQVKKQGGLYALLKLL